MEKKRKNIKLEESLMALTASAFFYLMKKKAGKKVDSFYSNIVFLVADTQLYKRLCPSVRPPVGLSVRPSVRPSVTLYFFGVFAVFCLSAPAKKIK